MQPANAPTYYCSVSLGVGGGGGREGASDDTKNPSGRERGVDLAPALRIKFRLTRLSTSAVAGVVANLGPVATPLWEAAYARCATRDAMYNW